MVFESSVLLHKKSHCDDISVLKPETSSTTWTQTSRRMGMRYYCTRACQVWFSNHLTLWQSWIEYYIICSWPSETQKYYRNPTGRTSSNLHVSQMWRQFGCIQHECPCLLTHCCNSLDNSEWRTQEQDSLNSEHGSNQAGFVHFGDTLKRTESFMEETATADRWNYTGYIVGNIGATTQTHNTFVSCLGVRTLQGHN